MGFTLLPGTARGAEGPRELWVDGVNALETPQGDGWSYDAGTGVLTLGGRRSSSLFTSHEREESGSAFPYRSSIYCDGDLTICLTDDIKVRYSIAFLDGRTYQIHHEGIHVSGDLTITGSHKLEIDMPFLALDKEKGYQNSSTCLFVGGELTVTGSTLTIRGGSAWRSRGIQCRSSRFTDASVTASIEFEAIEACCFYQPESQIQLIRSELTMTGMNPAGGYSSDEYAGMSIGLCGYGGGGASTPFSLTGDCEVYLSRGKCDAAHGRPLVIDGGAAAEFPAGIEIQCGSSLVWDEDRKMDRLLSDEQGALTFRLRSKVIFLPCNAQYPIVLDYREDLSAPALDPWERHALRDDDDRMTAIWGNYVLEGWYDQPNGWGNKAVDGHYEEGMAYYAHWTLNGKTVHTTSLKFDFEDGKNVAQAEQILQYDEKYSHVRQVFPIPGGDPYLSVNEAAKEVSFCNFVQDISVFYRIPITAIDGDEVAAMNFHGINRVGIVLSGYDAVGIGAKKIEVRDDANYEVGTPLRTDSGGELHVNAHGTGIYRGTLAGDGTYYISGTGGAGGDWDGSPTVEYSTISDDFRGLDLPKESSELRSAHSLKVSFGPGVTVNTPAPDPIYGGENLDAVPCTVYLRGFTGSVPGSVSIQLLKGGTPVIPMRGALVSIEKNADTGEYEGSFPLDLSDLPAGEYEIAAVTTNVTGPTASSITRLPLERKELERPQGIQAVDATVKGKPDGRITGVTPDMEYREYFEDDYKPVTGYTIENLPAGLYNVRYRSSDPSISAPYAQAEILDGPPLKVTYDLLDGTEPYVDPYGFSYNDGAGLLDRPERKNYTFAGWYWDRALTRPFDMENGTVTESLTLYARWTPGPLTGIKVFIKNSTGEFVAARSVFLWQGNTSEQMYGTSGAEYAGRYSLFSQYTSISTGLWEIRVTTEDSREITQGAVFTPDQLEATVILPAGKVMTTLTKPESGGNPASGSAVDLSGAVVTGLSQVAAKEAGTAGEQRVNVSMELSDQVKDEGGKLAIETAASGTPSLEFLDIALTKTVNQKETPITETDTVLELMIPYDSANRRNTAVYRCHDGTATRFQALGSRPAEGAYQDGTFYVGDGFIAIYTSKFSAYAVGYTEDFTVQRAVLSGGAVELVYTGRFPAGTVVYAARYENGRMTDVTARTLAAGQTTVSFPKTPRAGDVLFFTAPGSQAPLCGKVPLTA